MRSFTSVEPFALVGTWKLLQDPCWATIFKWVVHIKITKGVVSLHVRYNTNIQLNAVIVNKTKQKKKTVCFLLRPHFYSLLWFETDETPQDETKIHLSLQIVENSLRRFTEKLPYETFTFLHQSKHWLHRRISMLNFHLRLWIWRNLQFSTLMHWLCWTASTCLTLNCNFCFSPWDLIFSS